MIAYVPAYWPIGRNTYETSVHLDTNMSENVRDVAALQKKPGTSRDLAMRATNPFRGKQHEQEQNKKDSDWPEGDSIWKGSP